MLLIPWHCTLHRFLMTGKKSKLFTDIIHKYLAQYNFSVHINLKITKQSMKCEKMIKNYFNFAPTRKGCLLFAKV